MGHGLPAPEAARSLLHLAELHASLGELERARDELHVRAIAVDAELERVESTDDPAWAALGRVYELLGDPTREALVLERRILRAVHSSRPPADPALLYRLARARVADPETVEQGLDLVERCLDGGLDFEQAQELVRHAGATLGTSRRVPALLERIARERGDRAGLAEALLQRAENGDIEIAAVREGVALADELGAAALGERLLALALADGRLDAMAADAAWLRLEAASRARAAGNVARAIELEESAAAYLEPDAARELLMRVAREAVDPVQDFARGLRLYEILRAATPTDPELYRPLIALYRRLEQPDRAASLLAETAVLIDDPEQELALRLEQGELLLELGQREEAIMVLRDVVRDEPTHAGAAQRLSELLEAAGKDEDLIELLQAQVDAAKDRRDVEALVRHSQRLSLLLERRGRIHAAIDACRAALDWEPPESRELLEVLVRLSQIAGDPVELAEALELLLAVERGPAAPALARRLAAVREELGEPSGVERALELGFSACPNDLELCDLLVERYRQRGEHEQVADVLERAVQARPDDLALLDRLIDAQCKAGLPSEALAAIDRLLARGVPNATLLGRRAAVLGELGKDAEAVADLERAYALDAGMLPRLVAGLELATSRAPDPAPFALRLVDVLEATGDLAQARARLAERVELATEDRLLLARLAALDFRMENFELAATEYAELAAMEEGDGLVRAALKLADACERIGRPGEARRALDRAIEFDRGNAELRTRLLRLLEASGASQEYAEMLVEEASHETDATARATKLLRAGEIYLNAEGGGESAVSVLQSVREILPDSPEAVVLLSRAYTSTDRIPEAVALLHATVEANRGKRSRGVAAVYEELAEVHLAEGYLTDALQALQRAFEMDSRNARLGMRLARLALEAEEDEVAQRGFRAVAIMKSAAVDGPEGARPETKADANYALALLARKAGDSRRARVLVSKALGDFPDHAEAKALLGELDQK
jgi:tetratricopeptide (TPR) repeat protein